MRDPRSTKLRGATTASLRLLAAAALACAGAGAAQALQLHGVELPAQRTLGGQTLVLNGAGTRYVLFFKVYVAGLYLPHPARDASAALDMPGARVLRLVMLRDVGGGELADKLDSDLRDNVSSRRRAELAPALTRLHDMLSARAELREGQVIELRDTPGTGLEVDVDGHALGDAFGAPGLFDALLRIWLGPAPADARLKRALLGDTGAAR